MRKKLPVLIAVFLLIFAAGCASKSSTDDTGTKNPAATAQSDGTTQQTAPPDGTPDVMGKVKTISGNKVTVYKVTAPNNNQPPGNGTKPQGEGKKPPGQSGDLSPEERAQKRADMFQVTDETIDLTIPDDTPFVQDQGFGENKEIKKIDIGSIQNGDLLRIWYGDKLPDGGQSVKYIQVLNFKK